MKNFFLLFFLGILHLFPFQSWPLKPHSDVLELTFESDKMRALASFQDLYVGKI